MRHQEEAIEWNGLQRLYSEATETLQSVLEEKRVEQILRRKSSVDSLKCWRQLADAAERGDLETLHGLLQACRV